MHFNKWNKYLTLRKTWLSTWWKTPCWQSQRSDVSCSWPPDWHTSQEGFIPLLFPDPFQVIKVSRLTFSKSNLQLSPQVFYGINVWRLARPLQDLNVLLLEPFLCCLGRVFWVIVMLEYPSTTHFQCPGWLQCPVHRPFDVVQLSRPLSRKHPQSIMFPPPCLTVGMVFSSKHGELSWCQRAGFWSHLTTTLPPSSPLNHWQTSDRAVHVLSWAGGPCGRCRISVLHTVICYQLFS